MATVPHPPEGEFFRVVFEREKEKMMVDLWPRCLSLQASRPRGTSEQDAEVNVDRPGSSRHCRPDRANRKGPAGASLHNVVPSPRPSRPEGMAAYRRSNQKYRELHKRLAK